MLRQVFFTSKYELNSIQSTLDEVNQNIEDIEATIMELEDYKKTLLS